MNNNKSSAPFIAILTASLLMIASSASASIFSGWKPFRKPLEPANKASAEVSKAISGARATLPPTAQPQVEKIAKKSEKAEEAHNKAQETIGGQRDSFVLTAAGLCITNLFSLAGLLRGRRARRLADEKAQLEIDLLKAKLTGGDAGRPSRPGDPT